MSFKAPFGRLSLPKQRSSIRTRETSREWSLAGFLSVVVHIVLLLNLALIAIRSDEDDPLPEPVLSSELQMEEAPDESPVESPLDQAIEIPAESSPIQLPTVIANVETADLPKIASLTDLEAYRSHRSRYIGTGSPSGKGDWGILIKDLRQDGLDIVIVFDSTGSMGGEIQQVKDQMRRIGETLLKLVPSTRISLCTYRDRGDDYVVKGLVLTSQLSQLDEFLTGINASGGGDHPEAVDQGLRWAVEENRFRKNARKVILLFGDAPPHAEHVKDCLTMATTFHCQAGIVSTVTCRNHAVIGEFAQIARMSGGEAFRSSDERELMKQLLVLVFGSTYHEEVLNAFNLAENQNNLFPPKSPKNRGIPARFRSE